MLDVKRRGRGVRRCIGAPGWRRAAAPGAPDVSACVPSSCHRGPSLSPDCSKIAVPVQLPLQTRFCLDVQAAAGRLAQALNQSANESTGGGGAGPSAPPRRPLTAPTGMCVVLSIRAKHSCVSLSHWFGFIPGFPARELPCVEYPAATLRRQGALRDSLDASSSDAPFYDGPGPFGGPHRRPPQQQRRSQQHQPGPPQRPRSGPPGGRVAGNVSLGLRSLNKQVWSPYLRPSPRYHTRLDPALSS